jgi:hypothetical protein
MFKALKSTKNENFLLKLSSQIVVEAKNPVVHTRPKTGVFEICYDKFFKDTRSSSNFCQRNCVILEFPRHVDIPCKINITYQYRQFNNESNPFIKIFGVCANGPCQHEYIIEKKPLYGLCSVRFSINAIFLNNCIQTPVHDVVASSPLKGLYREQYRKEAEEKGALRAYCDSFNTVREVEIESYNYTSLVSPSVIRNVGSENNREKRKLSYIRNAVEERRVQEADPNKLFPGLVRNTVHEPYQVYCYTQEQLEIFTTLSNSSTWDKPLQLCCDTSGDIFPAAKTEQGDKKFYNFAITLTCDDMQSLPIGEFLTLKVDSKNVSLFLTNFVCDLRKLNNGKTVKIPEVFCTDFTWVNLHPILNVFLKTEIWTYLDNSFKQFENEEKSERSVVLIDKLHFIKFLLANSRKVTNKKVVSDTFVKVVLQLTKCRRKREVEELWVAMINVFGAEEKREEYQRIIEEISEKVDEDFTSFENDISEQTEDNSENVDYLVKNQIRKSSKFYTYFKDIHDVQISRFCEKEESSHNIFYCPALLKMLLEKYLPLFPLISLFVVPNLMIRDLPSSSSIENHWRNIKIYFEKTPLEKRFVSLYFPYMLGYFNAKTKEFLTMKKSKSLFNRLSNKRKFVDPTIFYPNFESKRRKIECDFQEEDGYTLRKNQEAKPCKFVGRKLDLNMIEKRKLEFDSDKKGRTKTDKGENDRGEITEQSINLKKLTVKKTKKEKQPFKIDTLLFKRFKLKEVTNTPRKRKPPSCGLCRSAKHTKRTCPMND